jgi:hypothetical protein
MSGLYYGGLRRDALEHLPADFAIGRAAFDGRVMSEFFQYEPFRVLVGTCTSENRALLAANLLSPIDFWDGKSWSPIPAFSTTTRRP